MHVALLFTDIEGSTRLLEQNAVGYARMLARHHGILRSLTGKFGGREFQDAGDGFMMSFPDAPSAARAALAMQKEIAATPWPEETGAPRVRMAVHWAESEFREGQYRGAAIHATSRLLGAAQGGQILCSEAARATFEQEMPARRLGAYRLRGFEEALTVFQLDPEKVFLPLRAEFARRHNLPPSQDAFVGRDQERRELAGLLSPESAARLITLTGPGGIGKTRLALAAAYEALDIYEHGVLYVPLAGATHSEELFGAILRALECDPHAEERLVDHVVKLLAGPPTLLVLDNFEQLSAEGSLALRLLLGELPNVKLFVTSRTRLGIAGETDFPVFTLRVPEEGETRVTEIGRCEAVCLFLDRAARVRKDFVLHSDNASAIVEICRALDGMPLAIELASARAQMLTAEELASELREGLSHRDAAGEGGVRSGLQLAFDWSVRMLPPDVASFFGSLSVFSGGWTPRTAAQVCDPEGAPHARAYLHYLLTCSLVQASEHAGGMRFVMLEPIRQLSQEYYPDAWRRAESRHRACFRTLASRLDAALGTADEGPLVDEAEPEISNILSALEREPSNQDRLFSAVDFHDFAYHRSCNRRLRALLTTLRPEGGEVRLATLARAWHAAGALDQGVRELEDAEKAYRRASELFRENGETNGAMSARFNLATLVPNEEATKRHSKFSRKRCPCFAKWARRVPASRLF